MPAATPKTDWIFRNAHIIQADRVIEQGDLLIRDGRIAAIGCIDDHALDGAAQEVIEVDAGGLHLMPGIIDFHTDVLEKEYCPRKGADFPLPLALHELDRKLLACGITTVYHSLHYGYQDAEFSMRSRYSREDVFRAVKAYGSGGSMARTRMHLRFEIAGEDRSQGVRELLDAGLVDLLSFMDHTPGQGQYQTPQWVASHVREGRSEAEALAELAERQARVKVPMDTLAELCAQAHGQGLVVASHDDDTVEKVRAMHAIGVDIAEFPVTLEAAQAAHALGMMTVGGAPNSLRGGSLTDNLDVNIAVRAGLIDGLCSDYYPPSILHAMVLLWRQGILDLPQAISLGTHAPARMLRQDHLIGELRTGLHADLLLVDLSPAVPEVLATFVNGRCVAQFTAQLTDRMGARARESAEILDAA